MYIGCTRGKQRTSRLNQMAGKEGLQLQIIHWLKNVHSSSQPLCTAPCELEDGHLGVSDTKAHFHDSFSSSTGGPLLIWPRYATEAMENSEDRASTMSGLTSQPLSPSRMRRIMSLLEQGNPPIRFCQPSKEVTQPSEVATLCQLLFKDQNMHIIPIAFEVSVAPPQTLPTGHAVGHRRA